MGDGNAGRQQRSVAEQSEEASYRGGRECEDGYIRAWRAWMSKMTSSVGPERLRGVLERMRASVKAVAISPSFSTRSRVPVGKNGSTCV